MADTGWLSGNTSGEDTSDGSVSWSGTGYSELLLEDGTTCGSNGDSGEPILTAFLVIGGAVSGGGRNVVLPLDTLAYATTGGASDKFDLTPTRAQVVASTFGVALQPFHSSSYYFGTVTTFSASITDGSTIDGFQVRAKCYKTDFGEGSWDIQVDHVQVKIYYTEGAAAAKVPLDLAHQPQHQSIMTM
jgi:hypothetical protein